MRWANSRKCLPPPPRHCPPLTQPHSPQNLQPMLPNTFQVVADFDHCVILMANLSYINPYCPFL